MPAAAPKIPVCDQDTVRQFLADSIGEDIHLVAITPDAPDGTGVHGAWFGSAVDDAVSWAARENAKGRNTYWTVNRTRRGFGRKPKKTDIEAARFMHVDIDPPKGAPFDRAAALAALESFAVPPSFIIDSGNGLQGFWRLDEQAGNLPAVEGYNRRLSAQFGGDNCHNIDRLMRLPGTVNFPDRKKVSAGRSAALASVAVSDLGESVEAETMHAVLPALTEKEEAERVKVALSEVQPVTLERLGIWPVDLLHPLVSQRRPGEDRSALVLRVAGALVRRDYTDEQIAGILLNPEYPVSDHCFDQPNPMRAVKRAIGRARGDAAKLPASGNMPGDGDGESRALVSATPFQWRDPAAIPLRPWVYGRWLLRNTITAVVAPGGVGKSALMASTILALATGRELLGKTVWGGPQSVWYWNLEDDGDELSRQVHAAAKLHGIKPADCGERLMVDSGLDGAGLCVAREDRDGFRIVTPVIEALVAELIGKRIDVLIIDPFVSSHTVSENDNGAIDAVAKEWARIAKRANCSIVLVHHTRKLAGAKVTAEMSRGAVALIAAARTALVLNRMDSEEATRFGIDSDKDRRRYFTVQDDKHNRAPPEDAEWYRMESVDLGNGDGDRESDNIGVVSRWIPPETFDGISTDDLRQCQSAIDAGRWRKSNQCADWVGVPVAETLGLDLNSKSDKARVNRIVTEWIKNGALEVEEGKDSKSNPRPFVIVGRWADDHSPLPHQQVRNGEEVRNPFPTTTTHNRVVGGEDGAGRSAGQWNDNPALGRKMILAPGETGDDGAGAWVP